MRKQYSFRFIITFTLIIVIAIVSFISFYFFNHALSRKIHAEEEHAEEEEKVVSILGLLKDQYYDAISDNDGRIIYSFLKRAEQNERIINTYLVDSNGMVLYPDKFKSWRFDSLKKNKTIDFKNEISVSLFEDKPEHYLRAFMKMQNKPQCYSCHSPDIKQLGYIVLDFSMKETEDKLALTTRFSVFYTVVMVIIIVTIILLMHYRFVKSSLNMFHSSIDIINKGDLSERVKIAKSKELGQLSSSFNEMMDKFESTREKLKSCYQKELKNTQKLANIGEISARLAHEIRNPITGIANAIDVFADEIKDEDQIPIIEEIKRQANRVNQAITDLLKYARSKELIKSKQDVNKLIESVVLFLHSQHQNKKIEFILTLQKNLPEISIDREQIENALLNIFINAVHAVNYEGRIEIITKHNVGTNMVKIVITDNGKGIPETEIDNIFKPFYTTKTEGTGLGLAIVKDIADKHHGEITVQNNTEKGCSFILSLPVVSPNDIIINNIS
ncbi:MAG: HAMP domain-containing protein [Chlorobi bacterium]|nr:HAMP domain-containing protein [Chlorobiota bacterium]